MIFVTVGTTHMRFDRLIEALDALPAHELAVQHGPVPPPPGAAYAVDFLPFGRIVELMREADVVVTHAGVGSVLCAINEGHVPIVVPRLRHFDETVDDHQVELAQALGDEGKLIPVHDAGELAAAVAAAPARGAPATARDLPIHDAVRSALG